MFKIIINDDDVETDRWDGSRDGWLSFFFDGDVIAFSELPEPYKKETPSAE